MLVVNKFYGILLLPFMVGSAFGAAELVPATSGAISKLSSAEVSCGNENAYTPQPKGQGKQKSECQKCQQAVKDWGKRMKGDQETAGANDSVYAAKGKAAIAKNAAAMQEQQRSQVSTASKSDQAGSEAQTQRAANAKALGEKFKSCAQEVEQACQGDIDQADKDKGKEAKQACEEGAKASEAVAADKAGSGMDMSKMGEMAGKAAEMLQQMMKKKEEGAKDAAAVADQAASGIAAPAEATIAATKSEGASQFAQSATFDGLEAARATTDGGGGAAAAAGNGAQAQSYTHGSEGSDTGTNGSDPRGGAGISSGGGSYSPTAGGGGGGSSSGASSYDPNAEAAKAAAGGADPASGAYEISSGGGGGSKFLGLKSKSSELSDLDGALGGEGGAGLNLAALGAEGEGRDPASEGSTQNADIHADGSSLFNVVRSKLVEIKKRGNI